MTQTTDSAAWRKKLDQLAESRATAEKALQAAQAKATDTALAGGDVTAAAKLVQQHRDVLDALEGARKEAEHQLEQAEAKEAAVRADAERAKAWEAMQARIVAAEKFDVATKAQGEAFEAVTAASELAKRHFAAAGGAPFSHAKLNSPGAIAGAVHHHAPNLLAALGIPRVDPARRVPLADIARQMAGDNAPTPHGDQTNE